MLSPRYWTFLLVVITAIAYSTYRHMASPELTISPADPYQYRYTLLNNGLKVLLVHAPNADKAAAAMTVNVGSNDDPKGREGLAHFLEHMLFLGTEPFPEPGEYQAYISRHGGSHNAFTANDQTTYFFDIEPNAFEGALDRFAPFFISPNFDEAYVEREKNAVHAEYTSKLKDDFRRIYSAEKHAMNPEHPFSQFSVGTLDTLADRDGSRIRDELLTFYDAHYSADRMTLVLAGKHSLDELEQWANSHFSTVPKRVTTARAPRPSLFAEGQLPLDLNIEPVKEIRRLQFTFPLPSERALYAYKPIHLLSSLIGHEGEGSLLAFLKQRGWAESLSAGRSLSNEYESTLVVQIDLTPNGLLHIDNITQALLHYIDLLKQQPLPRYLLDEQQHLAEMMFRFQEHGALSDYAVRLSTNLLVYPVADVIYGDYRSKPISADQLKPYLDGLNANNMLRTLIAPNIATDTIEPWYETPIRIRPMNYSANALRTEGLDSLHLPAQNPFIPDDLALHADAKQDTPSLLIHTAERQLWYYPEHEFKHPKAQVIVRLQLPTVRDSARERVLARLYAHSVNEALNTYSYPAHIAGLSYNLTASENGLEIALSGYQQKLPVLLEQILKEMKTPALSAEQFERYRAKLQRGLENQLKNKPFERAFAELKTWLLDPSFSEKALLDELEQVSQAEVEQFGQRFHQTLQHQIYVHGSLSRAQALTMANSVEQYFPAMPISLTTTSVLSVPTGQHLLSIHQDQPDNAFLLYAQGDNTDDRSRAQFALLGQIISSPYYHELRTEQQLGYVVFATQYPQRTVPALLFVVQSPQATPQYIYEQSRAFFTAFKDRLASMDNDTFAAYQQGLISLLQEKPKNMSEKMARFWRDIDVKRYQFDTNSAIAQEVSQLKLADIQALYEQVLLSSNKRWLAVTKGGTLTNWPNIEDVQRNTLSKFEPQAVGELPTAP